MKFLKILTVLFVTTVVIDVAAEPTNFVADASKISNLISQATNGQFEAILELGRSGDATVIPTLRSLNNEKSSPRIVEGVQMALAKLGDTQAFAAITNGLSSHNAQVQDEAINKLTYVADYRAISALGGLLNESEWRKEPKQTNSISPEMDKVFHEPLQILAIRALSGLVPDAPSSKTHQPDPKEIAKWQAWWQLNKSKFQSSNR